MNLILKDGQNFGKVTERVKDIPSRASSMQKAARQTSAVCMCARTCTRVCGATLACKVTGEISLLVCRITRPHERVYIECRSYMLHKRQDYTKVICYTTEKI